MEGFDTIYFKCPHCYHAVPFKSNAGYGDNATYSQGSVPLEIARAIAGSSMNCPNCGKDVKAVYCSQIPTVCMKGE